MGVDSAFKTAIGLDRFVLGPPSTRRPPLDGLLNPAASTTCREEDSMTETAGPVRNPVLHVPPAPTAEAAAYFRANLAFHTDVSDVAAALAMDGAPGFTLVDSRSADSWDQGHIPGAVHLPTAMIPEQAERILDRQMPVVTYCWGPACDGGVRSALALAELGYQVKEMRGGFEYWVREGFAYATAAGRESHSPDPLTVPVMSPDCGC